MMRVLAPAIRIRATAIAALTAAAALAAGCHKVEEGKESLPLATGRPGSARKTVTYMTRATPDQLAVWQKVTKAFESQHPDIHVSIENVQYDDYWRKLQTQLAGGTPPDVVFMESTRFPAFASKDSLINLEPYIEKDPAGIDLSDFYDVALKPYYWQGHLYGLPNDVAILALFYNKDLFDKAGLAYPTDQWTWDSFLAAAKKLTQDTNGDGRPDQYGTVVPEWWYVFVWQAGGEIVDDVQHPTRSTLQSPIAQGALQWWADLRLKHRVSPAPDLVQNVGAYQLFSTGQVAMIYGGHWDVPTFKQVTAFRWDAAPLPKGKVRANLNLGSCFSIMKGCKEPDAAWELIKFLAGADGQKIMVGSDFSTPALKSVAQSPEFLEPPPDSEHVFTDALAYGHPVPFTTKYVEMADVYRQETDALLIGERTVPETCKILDERITAILQE
jgi:multiple sugar transport system substrate-binding protein